MTAGHPGGHVVRVSSSIGGALIVYIYRFEKKKLFKQKRNIVITS